MWLPFPPPGAPFLKGAARRSGQGIQNRPEGAARQGRGKAERHPNRFKGFPRVVLRAHRARKTKCRYPYFFRSCLAAFAVGTL